jgi:hypothetical protein
MMNDDDDIIIISQLNSLPNNLHKLHPPPAIHLGPHRKRQPDPAAQVRALPLHLAEDSNVPPRRVTERSLDLEV